MDNGPGYTRPYRTRRGYRGQRTQYRMRDQTGQYLYNDINRKTQLLIVDGFIPPFNDGMERHRFVKQVMLYPDGQSAQQYRDAVRREALLEEATRYGPDYVNG